VKPVDLIVAISGPDSGDETRSLYAWLTDDEELRGRSRLANAEPPPGTLGAVGERWRSCSALAGSRPPRRQRWWPGCGTVPVT
jgi:hypothetical protein